MFGRFIRHLLRAPCLICNVFSDGHDICIACRDTMAGTRWGVKGLSVRDRRIPVIWREPYGGLLTASLYQAKYNGQWRNAYVLGQCLAGIPNLLMGKAPVVIPVPLASARLAYRGYNQSDWIARGLARGWGLDHRNRWLKKINATRRQTLLPRRIRIDNLHQTFLADRRVRGHRVLLVDDIMTTGATLVEAERAIAARGGEVIGAVVVAYAEHRSR